MTIKKKILIAILSVLLFVSIIITSIWYGISSSLTNTYLKNISESTMRDAYHAFEYLLTDTSYMTSMIALNESNIIQPAKILNEKVIKQNGQWNQDYLDNKRIIEDYIKGLNGYKYYIVGITVVVNQDCIFSSSHIMENHEELYHEIMSLNQDRLKNNMIMMNPIHAEGGKSTPSSNYVVPAVKAITDWYKNPLGYIVLYFDYSVIEKMFSSNLPEDSQFQVVNENQSIIFSNCGDQLLDEDYLQKGFAYHTFHAEQVGWTFTMAIPSDYYIKDINQTAWLTTGLTAVTLILTGIAITIIISRMTTEITVLKNSMKEVSQGNFEISYPIKSKDEIGQMGHTFNYMVVHIRELMQKVADEEQQKRLVEMDFLQAQIKPHFISNALNTVVWMAKIQHADNIVPLITSLTSLLQSAMHQNRDMITLKEELDYANNYLTLMEYVGNYDFTVNQEPVAEDTEQLYVLRFILQPIIENAIYHGLPKDLSKLGCITIKAVKQEVHLILIVEDNGIGMTEEQLAHVLDKKEKNKNSFNGIGVRNVHERIQLFFGNQYGLFYESELDQYTRAVFVLPVITGREGKWLR